MKSFIKSFCYLIIVILSVFTSINSHCIARYKAIPLRHLQNNAIADGAISFVYKKFNEADCKKYLGRRHIINKGFLPIQIQITNNTDRSFLFSLNNFSFPCVSYLNVIEHIYFNTALRLWLWGLGSLVIPILIIPFILEAIESPRANERLENDYANKCLNIQKIKPYNTINGLIFVPIEYFNENFSFNLIDLNNNEKLTLYSIKF